MMQSSYEKKTLHILFFIFLSEGVAVLVLMQGSPERFIRYLGFSQVGSGTSIAWALAAAIATAYVWSASQLSDVRAYLLRGGALKGIAIVTAVMAAILEEIIFRRLIMDGLQKHGYGAAVQVLASGVCFGLVHLIWGIKDFRAGVNAVVSTSLLGCGLAIVYLIGERSLAPCVVAHFVITALIEPGLILSAVKGKVGYWNENS